MPLVAEIVLTIVQFFLSVGGNQLQEWWKERTQRVKKRVPTLVYFRTRVVVRKWLNSKMSGEDVSVWEKINHLLCTDTGGSMPVDRGDSADRFNISSAPVTIDEILQNFLNKSVGPDTRHKAYILNNYRNALIFEISKKVLNRPSEILGQRKSVTIQRTIDKLVNEILGDENGSCKKLFDYVKVEMTACISWLKDQISKSCHTEDAESTESSRITKCLTGIWFYLPIVAPILTSLAFYCLDYSSDYGVNKLYSCLYLSTRYPNGQQSTKYYDAPIFSRVSAYLCPTNLSFVPSDRLLANLTWDNAETPEETIFVLNLRIGYNFLLSSVIGWIIFCISVPASVSSLRSVWHLFKIKEIMKNEKLEKNDKDYITKVFFTGNIDVLNLSFQYSSSRYDLSKAEASYEGSLQLCLQLTTYITSAWLITWLKSNYTEAGTSQDPLQFYNPDLPFHRQLWFSFAASTLSIALASTSRRKVNHEFSDSFVKESLYFLCCLLNTVMIIITLVSMSTAFVQLFQMWIISDGIPSIGMSVFILFFLLGCLGFNDQ